MTTMIAELYDALRDAGGSDEKARKAAQSVAAYESRFSELNQSIIGLPGDINLLRWMVGFNMALTLAVFAKPFVH